MLNGEANRKSSRSESDHLNREEEIAYESVFSHLALNPNPSDLTLSKMKSS